MNPSETHSETPDISEGLTRRRIIGILLFPIALFPLLALLSYDWHCVPELLTPAVTPTANLIGPLGDRFAYVGYALVGLALWTVPLFCVAEGLLLLCGRSFHPTRRTAGIALFLFSFTCLLQPLGRTAPVAAVLRHLNLADAGGAIGYLVMNCGLTRMLSDFGASVLMLVLAALSLIMIIGLRSIMRGLGSLTAWAADRQPSPAEIEMKRREREDREAEKRALAEAKAAAKAARAEEKRLAREAKAAEKASQTDEADLFGGTAPAPSPADDVRSMLGSLRQAARNDRTNASAAPEPTAPAVESAPVDKGPYLLPGLDLLAPRANVTAKNDDVDQLGTKLVDTLKLFNVDATLAYTVVGPVVTRYALTLAPGTKPEAVKALTTTLQMSMKAKSLRIEAPIPGEDAVGIEIPNPKPVGVTFREIVESPAWTKNVPWPRVGTPKYQLPLVLGKDAAGKELVSDLATMPHMLVAGATGQGKSVCLNAIINGLLLSRTPQQLKFIMVDPKSVEFTSYASLPHLLVPVVTDNHKVVFSLRWAVAEMEKRLKLFARHGKRNIVDYNARPIVSQPDLFSADAAQQDDPDNPRTVPYIVIIIDEVADLMATAGRDVEPLIARLTAKARAAGIHLILATQRPDTKVITGTIKSNIPGRIAFKTSQGIDSRTILDATGAEQLIGRGDMLFKTKEGLLIRAQGAWVSDEEIARITSFIAEHANTQFDDHFASKLAKVKEAGIEDPFADNPDDPDNQPPEETEAPVTAGPVTSNGVPPPKGLGADKENQMYLAALDVVARTGRASTSHLQRRMGIGYNHAARLIDLLEDAGVIGPAKGAGPRDILLDPAVISQMAQGGTPGADPAPVAETPDGDLPQEHDLFDTANTSTEE